MERIKIISFSCFLLPLGIVGAVFSSCIVESPTDSTSASLSLNPSILSVAVAASSDHNFVVTTSPSDLVWTVEVTSGSEWCTARPESGAGEGTVTLDIAENTLSSTRSATITVTAILPDTKAEPLVKQFTVTQAAALPTLSVDKTHIDAAIEANSYPILVTSNVAWTAVPDAGASWCSLSPNASGSSDGTFSIIVERNSGEVPREATITVRAVSQPSLAERSIKVTQAVLPPALSVDKPFIGASTAEHFYPVAVTANGSWTASVNSEASSWCSIENPAGIGNGTFSVSVQTNPGTSARKTFVTVSSRGLTVTIAVSQVYEFTETNASSGSYFGMIGVAGGTFTMGGFIGDSDAQPPHSVTITKNYAIGKFEVTQRLWMDLMGDWPNTNPNDVPHPPAPHSEVTNMVGDDYPMYYVNSADIQRFLTELNARTGKAYRLPTEAEWEYAARGGVLGHGYSLSGGNDINKVAWYIDNSGRKTHQVGRLAPNELGIYDMSGNVWELCSDWFGPYSSSAQTDPAGPAQPNPREPNYVARGGALDYDNVSCHVAYRMRCSPVASTYHLGFRLALTLEDSP